MSKTSYFLVGILLIIIVCFLAAAFLYPHTTSIPTLTSDKKTVQKTVAQSTVSLSPITQTLTPGQTSSVDVFISNDNVSPDTIQLEIGYDPYTITPVTVTPGKYFNEQTVLFNTINPRNSRITLAITCTNKPSPCGSDQTQSIAKILFTVNPLAMKKETAINILPKTLVASDQTPNISIKTTSMKIGIRGIQVQQASPSAMILPQ